MTELLNHLASIDSRLFATLLLLASLAIQIGLAVRVIMRRRGVGESLAWIFLVMILPIGGPLLYLLFGELRLGSRRARRFAELQKPVVVLLEGLHERSDPARNVLDEKSAPLARLATQTLGVPVLPGNHLELLVDWQHVFDRLIADIDAATHHCHLEFYIIEPGGRVDEVFAALERANARGVACRLLADAVGSRPFSRSKRVDELRKLGIEVVFALPGGVIRMWFVRFDLRLHRKIVIIDGTTAYTGSLNLVDPRYFKQDSGVGQWVDAMARVTGPAVDALAITFLADWYVESQCSAEELREKATTPFCEPTGDSIVQAMPSGPNVYEEAVDQVLVAAVYAAQRELILTTPYFVPNEALMTALETAARRGVAVTLILPARVDSFLVRYATGAFQHDLLDAGIRVARFKGGLLHTKSVSIDGEISLFGSLNLDERSFYLNFEITLAVYDRAFTSELRKLQHQYLADCSDLTDTDLAKRRYHERFIENLARLFGPVL